VKKGGKKKGKGLNEKAARGGRTRTFVASCWNSIKVIEMYCMFD
jgi:hypothetical protein